MNPYTSVIITKGNKISKWVILEDGKFNVVWDSVSNLTYIMSFILIPLVIATSLNLHDDIRFLEFVIDIILAIDIVFNFFTTYHSDVKKVTDLEKISYHYLTNLFVFDFIAVVPGLVTIELFKHMYYLKLLRYLRLSKLFEQIRFVLEKLDNLLIFVNKKAIESFLTLARCLFGLLFLIHVMACFWILLGQTRDEGWLNTSTEFENIGDNYLKGYPTAVYFITTTFSTVGYGDFSPNDNYEIILVMILELIGLAVFSFLLGTLSSIERQQSANTIIKLKEEQLEEFLIKLNASRKDTVLPYEIFKESLNNVSATYKYGVKYVFNMFDFAEQLKPQDRKQLTFYNLKRLYIDFQDFFYDEDVKFQANDRFISRVLTNFECSNFLFGKTILERGEQCENLYFIGSGKVLVKNHKDGEVIAILQRYSVFGDYQIFLDTRSNLSFVCPDDEEVTCYTLPKDKFLDLCHRNQNHVEFFMKRALITRRLFKRLVIRSHDQEVN